MYYNYNDTGFYWVLIVIIGICTLVILIMVASLIRHISKKSTYERIRDSKLFAFTFAIMWAVLIFVSMHYANYYFLGGQEEQVIEKKYEAIVKEATTKFHNNFNESNTTNSASPKANGIIILSGKEQENIRLESYLMYILPDYLKQNIDAYPQLIILISVQSEKVATIYGYNSGAIYSSSYIFKIFDFKNGQLFKTLQSIPIRDKKEVSKFPINFYKKVLSEAHNILTQSGNYK